MFQIPHDVPPYSSRLPPLPNPPPPPPLPLAAPPRKFFVEGQDVLVSTGKGILTFGIVVEVDPDVEQCLVRFGDCTEKWSAYRHIKRLGEPDDVVEEQEPEDTPPVLEMMVDPDPGYGEEESNLVIDEDPEDEAPLIKKVRLKKVVKKKPSVPQHVIEARNELPYDFASLKWDVNHTKNDKQRYCYCGEPGDWYKKMIQCHTCLQWFHQECLRTSTPEMLGGDRFFEFGCALCMSDGKECLKRLDMSWVEALHLVLFNLSVNNSKKYHDLRTSILPFFKRKLQCLQGPDWKLKSSRVEPHFVNNLLSSNKSRFKCGSSSSFWGLRKLTPPDLPKEYGMSVEICYKIDYKKVEAKRVKNPHKISILKKNNVPTARKRGRPVRDSTDAANSTADSDTSSKGTLDTFIPHPVNFRGSNNPYVKYGECPEQRINPFESLRIGPFSSTATARSNAPSVETSPSSSGVSSGAASTSSSSATPGLLLSGSGGTRSPQTPPVFPSSGGGGGGGGSASPVVVGGPPGSSGQPQKTPGKFLNDLKHSLNSYFGAETRISKGEKFKVIARRLTIDGDIQYLIEWDQLNNPLSPPLPPQTPASSATR